MIWRDNVFKYGPKYVTLGADFEGHNWKHDLARLCFMLLPRAMAMLGKKWKLWNLLVRRLRPLWCQWRPLCGLENFEKKIKILNFFCKFWKSMKIVKISSWNFQNRKQILTLRGVYWVKNLVGGGSGCALKTELSDHDQKAFAWSFYRGLYYFQKSSFL